MTAALRTDPELIGRPRHAGPRVAHVHLRAAALTPNVTIDVGHGGILASYDPCVIPAIVLAAGKSSRMGRLKANLPRAETTHFSLASSGRCCDAGVDDVVIVVGHEMDAVLGSFAESGLSARFVENADYESGQLSSLLAGLRVVDRPGVVAALITLVDVPFVSAANRSRGDRSLSRDARAHRPADAQRPAWSPDARRSRAVRSIATRESGRGGQGWWCARTPRRTEMLRWTMKVRLAISIRRKSIERALSVFASAARVASKDDARS